MTTKGQKQINIPVPQQPQNQRQFKCKCTKIYKSYPALYTHIKNKHPNQIDEFKKESKRPKEGQIDKGRPKKHRDRPIEADEQGDLLNIIELGIMEIEKCLRNQVYSSNHEQRFQILQGNAKLKEQDLRHHYSKQKSLLINKILQTMPQKQLISKLNQKNYSQIKKQPSIRIYKQDIRFKNQLIQHFNAITSAKILIQLELLELEEEPLDETISGSGQIDLSDSVNVWVKEAEEGLWEGKEGIVKVIRDIYLRWNGKVRSIQAMLEKNFRKSHQSEVEQSSEEQNQYQQEPQLDNSNQQEENDQEHNSYDDVIDSCIN